MFVVCCSLHGLRFDVLFLVKCVLLRDGDVVVYCCLLCVGFVVCRLMAVASCVLFVVWCLLYVACYC